MIFKAKEKTFDISDRPLVMGVLNVTPDSFYDGAGHADLETSLRRVESMIEDGADIIDVGGESTRPGSKAVEVNEEVRRVLPVIEEISKKFEIPLSIDTYKPAVARKAIECGAVIINDIYALTYDDGEMASVAAASGVGVILMHMKGSPETMQNNPSYSDVVKEIKDFFTERLDFALKKGIGSENIMIDPGIGFGKTFQHNIALIKKLNEFLELKRPIVVGLSRKSFIGKILDDAPPEDRLFGTMAANMSAYLNGARIFRVHDVKATRDFFNVLSVF